MSEKSTRLNRDRVIESLFLRESQTRVIPVRELVLDVQYVAEEANKIKPQKSGPENYKGIMYGNWLVNGNSVSFAPRQGREEFWNQVLGKVKPEKSTVVSPAAAPTVLEPSAEKREQVTHRVIKQDVEHGSSLLNVSEPTPESPRLTVGICMLCSQSGQAYEFFEEDKTYKKLCIDHFEAEMKKRRGTVEQDSPSSVSLHDYRSMSRTEVLKEVVEQHNGKMGVDEAVYLASILKPESMGEDGYRVIITESSEFAISGGIVSLRDVKIEQGSSVTSNGVKIMVVDYKDYLVSNVPTYVAKDKELDVIDAHLVSGLPLLIRGPKGTGKTLGIAYYAFKKKIPIIQFDCAENTKRFDLVGRFLPKGDKIEFLLGSMAVAIEVANQAGMAVLSFEEINALSPQMQKSLNQLLDWRRHVFIPEIGKTFALNDNAKLLIVATMNPSTYGGVFELNEDLKSRFAEIDMKYPSEKEEEKIINEIVSIPDILRSKILTIAAETRSGMNKGELSYALSTRDVVMFCNVYNAYAAKFTEKVALRLAVDNTITNRYEDKQERETITTRLTSVFGNVLD